MPRRRRRLARGLLVAVTAVASAQLVSAGGARAQAVIADLSSREIAITTGFTGADLLLFGATDGFGDIVVTVIGPRRDEVVRRKHRVAGIWINGASLAFEEAPAYYHVASSRPLAEIAPAALLRSLALGTRNLALAPKYPATVEQIETFQEALIRNKQRVGLYSEGPAGVRIIGGRLFRSSVEFPAGVPTGIYEVTVHLFDGGELISAEQTLLTVRRVGLEAEIFNFAHDHAAWYGVIAIVVALVAGWLAGVIFRRA